MYRYDDALEVLERALEVRPDDPDLALSRAIVQLEKGATEAALEELRRYRAHPRVKRPSALYYAYAVLTAGMADRQEYAVQVGREGLQHYPENGPILVNTGAVLERRGELEAAMALYGRAVQTPHPPAQAHKNLGDHAYARGDLEQARMHYEKAVKIEPRLGDDVYVRLGTIAYRDKDVDVARLLWRRALELNPGNEAVRGQLELVDASA
jgi:tetratricopeptide (TPR) repeat protein